MKLKELKWYEHVLVFIFLIIGYVYAELQTHFINTVALKMLALFVVCLFLSYVFFVISRRRKVEQLSWLLSQYWAFLVLLIIIFYDWFYLRVVSYRQAILMIIVLASPVISGRLYKILNR